MTGKARQRTSEALWPRPFSAEIAVIHRRLERLVELGASNASFAKEIADADVIACMVRASGVAPPIVSLAVDEFGQV
jgi:hypothetical protein